MCRTSVPSMLLPLLLLHLLLILLLPVVLDVGLFVVGGVQEYIKSMGKASFNCSVRL